MKHDLQDDLKAATSRQERRRITHRLWNIDTAIQSSKSQVHEWEEKASQQGEKLKQLETEEGLFCVQ